MKKIFALSLIAAFISSCTKPAGIKLPDQEKKLVVTCLISPNDSKPVTAVVRLSDPKFTSDTTHYTDEVTNATVVMNDGTNSIILTYKADHNCYESASPSAVVISEGKTYHLTVTTPDGKYANASTTVPVGLLSVKSFDVFLKDTSYNSINYDAHAEVDDIANQTNYVCLIYSNIFDTRSMIPGQTYDSNGYDEYSFFDSDERISKSSYISTYKSGNIYSQDTMFHAFVHLNALNCSKEFYLYQNSLQNAGNQDNPFADPALIYTNMVNGFGCFGAYTLKVQSKQVR